MSKQKMVEDPGDEARERVQGKMPPTADDALSTEKTVLVDELHGTITEGNVTDAGVSRIFVGPLRVADGHGPVTRLSGRVAGMRTPMDDVHECNERYAEAHDRALAECPPPVLIFVDVVRCAFGGLCLHAGCEVHGDAGCRAGKALAPERVEVGRRWPSPEEYAANPEASKRGWGDPQHEQRLKDLMQTYGAAEAAVKRAEARAIAERDAAIFEARREERRRPTFLSGGAEAGRLRSKTTYDSVGMRR